MELITPQGLQPGDKIATVSLSWGAAGELPHRYATGKERLEKIFGLEVIATTHALEPADWIYNNPQARAADLMEAFADPTVKAIIANIGGEDSVRMLPYIDLGIIRNNPKIFLGFSDSTITHFICMKAGLGSFYGPALLTGFAENVAMHDYQVADIKRTLFSREVIGQVKANEAGWTSEFVDWFDPSLQHTQRKLEPATGWRFVSGSGVVQGRLIGGCMEVMEMLKGTEYWPELSVWEDSILFFETSEDKPWPGFVRYWIRNYASLGILQRAKGIILGRPYDNLYALEYETELLKVLNEEGLTDMPVITRMDFGHTAPVFTIPYGRLAEINCDQQSFSILEPGVR
ncbi:S66 family peptidase [Taibaiella chishuiensis]|uniref:Muramoyltetrapeptide carboxypeptidase LdcA involved in peptidoglycan recycling n=1 Tax=Taibaiella chishuiensis TaxID=1434707 RepID=A0A2P8CSN9_9BACT|nr:S66 peptidase family protein [Taibaiella chishuiensis]PSK87978.1 muramoyltetrapeptide carboxypeptidase LdcA involved in peptidoglycan recycling [Taibaiella chishuiensis]